MSIDLDVYFARAPRDLRGRWQAALAGHGLACEFRPDFDPDTWAGGELVARVQTTRGLILYGDKPFVTGCQLDVYRAGEPAFEEERADVLRRCPRALRARLARATRQFFFSTSAGRSPEGLRFHLFAVGTLAAVTGGLVSDPQEGTVQPAREVLDRAAVVAEAADEEVARRLRGRRHRVQAFRSWPQALRDTVAVFVEPEG